MLPPAATRKIASVSDPDDAIQATDDDAAASRQSAVNIGYLSDPFVSMLYKPPRAFPGNAIAGPSSRKPPLINIGTHHRTYAIDLLVDQFLDSVGEDGGQIVSLGAGSDTRYFRLRSRTGGPSRLKRYIELDFAKVTSTKAQRIARSPKLSSLLSPPPSSTATSSPNPLSPESLTGTRRPYEISQGGTCLISSSYALLPVDLRHSPAQTLETALLPNLDTRLPTLFIAECVFCYMPPERSEEIIKWFGETFKECMGVIYEMCGLSDTFGAVMQRNLKARGLDLPGAMPFPTVESEAARFTNSSLRQGRFAVSGAKALWDIRQNTIPKEELDRISKLEMLDEIEELKLVLGHYVVAWGTKGDRLQHIEL